MIWVSGNRVYPIAILMRQIVILQLIRGIQFSDKPICGTAGQRKILQLKDECERVNPVPFHGWRGIPFTTLMYFTKDYGG